MKHIITIQLFAAHGVDMVMSWLGLLPGWPRLPVKALT